MRLITLTIALLGSLSVASPVPANSDALDDATLARKLGLPGGFQSDGTRVTKRVAVPEDNVPHFDPDGTRVTANPDGTRVTRSTE